MKRMTDIKKFAKFLDYLLGRRPDEFGLVLDAEGFVKIKELLKALHEEKNWRHIRRSHLDEVVLTHPQPPIEILDNRIRACRLEAPKIPDAPQNPPKLLYTCIRAKAYPRALQSGVYPSHHAHVVLSSDPEMAMRIGRRSDAAPVLLVVQVRQALQNGSVFKPAGESIYVTDFLPPEVFTGPPLPKEKAPPVKEAKGEVVNRPPAGSFFLEIGPAKPPKSTARGKSSGPDETRGRSRKPKRKREKPPWRR
jgi:putative RNA 2'-phosphotransferase